MLTDMRLLIGQGMALARTEAREELQNLLMLLVISVTGAATLAFAVLWILHGLTRGVSEFADWPLWAAYAVTGCMLGLIGLVLIGIARARTRAMQLLPQTRHMMSTHLCWPVHDEGAHPMASR